MERGHHLMQQVMYRLVWQPRSTQLILWDLQGMPGKSFNPSTLIQNARALHRAVHCKYFTCVSWPGICHVFAQHSYSLSSEALWHWPPHGSMHCSHALPQTHVCSTQEQGSKLKEDVIERESQKRAQCCSVLIGLITILFILFQSTFKVCGMWNRVS